MNIISAQIFSARSVGRTIHSRSLFYFHKVLTISRNIESIFLTIWKEIAVQLNFSHLKERFNRFQNIFTDFLCRSWYKRIIMHSAILDSISIVGYAWRHNHGNTIEYREQFSRHSNSTSYFLLLPTLKLKHKLSTDDILYFWKVYPGRDVI